MAKEDFNQVSASFGAVQCILSSILCPSIFRPICRHFNGSPILCPINATSSSSYVFRLQYPRVLHCRIVLKEKYLDLLRMEEWQMPNWEDISSSEFSILACACALVIFYFFKINI